MTEGERRSRLAERWVLGALVLIGAALRFVDLDAQSYWVDEALTAGFVDLPLRLSWHAVSAQESTPHLYFTAAWVWTRIFGDGETALRSLSALVGTLTIPVAWAAARHATGRIGALAAAAFVAVNPTLVWYSQDARAYAMLAFLAGVATWLCLRARDEPSPGRLVLWALAATLTMYTHYTGGFVVAAQGVLLLPAFWRTGLRGSAPAGTVLAVGAAGLLAIASRQPFAGPRGIGGIPLGDRLEDAARGLFSASTDVIAAWGDTGSSAARVGYAAVIGALALLAWRLDPAERRRAMPIAVLAAGGVLVPLALAIPDLTDFFLDRNLLPAAVPLAAGLGVVVGGRRARGLGIGLAAAACLAGVAVDMHVRTHPEQQRPSWRALVRGLGHADSERVLVLIPGYASAPVFAYGQSVTTLPRGGLRTREIAVLGDLRVAAQRNATPPPGFALFARRGDLPLGLFRYRSTRPRLVTPRELTARGYTADGLLLLYASG
jgi:mannosyltransferase